MSASGEKYIKFLDFKEVFTYTESLHTRKQDDLTLVVIANVFIFCITLCGFRKYLLMISLVACLSLFHSCR